MTAPPGDRRRVAVIGAGWAGCTAALELARRGLAVTVYEQARMPGGRARRVLLDGVPVDNGQHLLLGAYSECLRVIAGARRRRRRARVAAVAAALQPWVGSPVPSVDRARPALGTAGAVGARGLRLAPGMRWPRACCACAATAAIPATATVADWFRTCPGGLRRHRRAAVRGGAEHAARGGVGTGFAKVLDTALGGSRADSDFLVPTTDLSSCCPSPRCARSRRRGELRLGAAAQVTASAADGVTVEVEGHSEIFSDVVVAVGPHQLAQALGARPADLPGCRAALAMAGAFAYEPIVTVYLGFRAPVAMTAPVMRLDDRPGQWLFDRHGGSSTTWPAGTATMLAVVISAHGAHQRMEREALAAPSSATAAPDRPAA
jgi:hypothetical protein